MIPIDSLVFFGFLALFFLALFAWDEHMTAKDRAAFKAWQEARVRKAIANLRTKTTRNIDDVADKK